MTRSVGTMIPIFLQPVLSVNRPRQIILIMTDIQRTDMLGCYGNADMRTPCLDALAAQAVRFDRAYTCRRCLSASRIAH